MSLETEIEANRKKIHTDAYPMSIGELVNLYRDEELVIDPAYQRLYRWSDQQKAKLIDSFLLGIPTPSIFVSQLANGAWELVDGLQRVSTILQLMGVLKGPNGELMEKLILSPTKTLPSLKGKYWSEDVRDPNALSSTERLLIKRTKIDVQIVKKESDVGSKFELFQRLNTMGSVLEPMEIRNCLLIMIDPSFAEWLKRLAEDVNFQACIELSDRSKEQLGDREMVSRFLAFRKIPEEDLNNIGDVTGFLDDKLASFALDPNFNREIEEVAFRETFSLLAQTLGSNAFKRYDMKKGDFSGMFLVSGYEVIAMGIGFKQPGWIPNNQSQILKIAKNLWKNIDFTRNSGAGVRASTRVRTTIPLGRTLFKKL